VSKVGAKENVALIQLNRPKALNALSDDLLADVGDALREVAADDSIGASVITGSARAFAAGADIKRMFEPYVNFAWWEGNHPSEGHSRGFDTIQKHRKPTIAAVDGICFGGGCELAMMCDIMYAGEKAIFGQPEIKLGIIPGAGGTQRLTRTVGKSLAMEMCLAGDPIKADQALAAGLVSKICKNGTVVEEAIKTAERIAKNFPLTLKICKEAVAKSQELSLKDGLDYERRLFHATFATEDRKEGMSAFVEKRPATFKNK